MTITIILPTVGEPGTIETLKNITQYTKVPYDLLIWYDACGRGFDWEFYKSLLKYSDNIIFSTQNQGLPKILSYAFLYTETDYVLFLQADCMVRPHYLEKHLEPFEKLEKVGVTGDSNRAQKNGWEVNTVIMPDISMMASRDCINDCGAMSPTFKIYAQEVLEFMERTKTKDWKVVAIDDTMDHIKDDTQGREKLSNLQELIKMNEETYRRLERQHFTGYNWWRNDL